MDLRVATELRMPKQSVSLEDAKRDYMVSSKLGGLLGMSYDVPLVLSLTNTLRFPNDTIDLVARSQYAMFAASIVRWLCIGAVWTRVENFSLWIALFIEGE